MAAYRDAWSLALGNCWHQIERDSTEQCALWTTRWEMDADAGHVLNDACSDFEKPFPDTYKLGLGERVTLGNCRAHRVHQPERSCVQYETNLIGRRAVA